MKRFQGREASSRNPGARRRQAIEVSPRQGVEGLQRQGVVELQRLGVEPPGRFGAWAFRCLRVEPP